jgi:tyrosinase
MPIVEDSEAEEREPELVGATERPIELTGKPETVTVDIDRGAAEAALGAAAAKPEHVYLSVDDIEGERNPGTVYGLYVNLPDEASPAVAESHHAGNVSFFGIERARNPRGDEQPHNLQMTTEITDLARALEADGEWSGDRVEVSFRPLGLIPDDRPELAHALPESVSESDPPVRIGRVSILYS